MDDNAAGFSGKTVDSLIRAFHYSRGKNGTFSFGSRVPNFRISVDIINIQMTPILCPPSLHTFCTVFFQHYILLDFTLNHSKPNNYENESKDSVKTIKIVGTNVNTRESTIHADKTRLSESAMNGIGKRRVLDRNVDNLHFTMTFVTPSALGSTE